VVVARYRLNVDYTSATKGDDDGHPVFTPNVNVTGGSGLSTNDTIVGPLGTQAIAAAVAVTPATSSSWTVAGTVTANAGAGTGSIATAQVTVTTGNVSVVAARAGRASVTIINLGTVDVWLGVTGVSTSTGILLLGVKGSAVTIPTSAAVFGTVGSGTQAVAVLESF
jgi:hypothetical protein